MRILRQYHVNIHRKIIFAKQYLYSKYDIRYRITFTSLKTNTVVYLIHECLEIYPELFGGDLFFNAN